MEGQSSRRGNTIVPLTPPRVEKGTPNLTSDTAGKGSWKEAAGEEGGGGRNTTMLSLD